MSLVLNRGSSKGVALIIVLWIVVILSAIALEFSYSMRIETDLTRNFLERQKAYYGARAGIERAVKEVFRARKAMVIFKDKDTTEEPLWDLGGNPNNFTLGDIEITVTIEPENSRVDIHGVSREFLKEILLAEGLNEEKADAVIDCVLDWEDGDNLHRTQGAEKEYYQELDTPYQPANTKIEVLEELLMIKGIDKGLYYGKDALPTVADFISEEDEEQEARIQQGLSTIFTVYRPEVLKGKKKQSKVDLNSAPEPVLMSLPLMDKEAAQAIIDARKEGPIKTVAELVNLIGLPLYKGIQGYVTLGEKDIRHYTITSTAFSGQEGLSHSIRVVLDITPGKKKGTMPFYFNKWEDWKI
jgi:general secretion pathway protein K